MTTEGSTTSPVGRSRAVGFTIAVLTVCLIFAAGVYAYLTVFNRSGERAISLIPSDALLVATLDTTPSPEQAITFSKISAALQREGLYDSFTKSINSAGSMPQVIQDIQPYWKKSFAVAAFAKPNDPKATPNFVVLAAVSDTGAVRGILSKYGVTQSTNGFTYFSLPKDKMYATVLGTYIVAADTPGALVKIADTYSGKTKSVNTLPAYQSARSVLPSDTNLMLFVSPQGFSTFQTQMASMANPQFFGNQSSGMASPLPGATVSGLPSAANAIPPPLGGGLPIGGPGSLTVNGNVTRNSATIQSMGLVAPSSVFRTTQWLAVGFRVVDSGFEVVGQTPLLSVTKGRLPEPQAPIRADLAQRLPAGACGLITVSQVTRYWDWMDYSNQSNPATAKAISDAVSAFEKSSGLNLKNDLLPGLSGDVTLAVYPDDAIGAGRSVDGLLVIDDQNGGDPSKVVEKIRAYYNKTQAQSHGPQAQFESHRENGVAIYTLDSVTQKVIDNSVNPPTPPTPKLPPGFTMPAGSTAFTMPTAPRHASKTFTYAVIGKAVVMATSKKLLTSAIAAYQNQTGALSQDPNYVPLLKTTLPGSQSMFIISAPPIVDLMKPLFGGSTGASGGPGLQPADYMAVFGNNAGMVVSAAYDGKSAISKAYIRLDIDKLIHVMGVSAKQAATATGVSGFSGSTGGHGAPQGAMQVN